MSPSPSSPLVRSKFDDPSQLSQRQSGLVSKATMNVRDDNSILGCGQAKVTPISRIVTPPSETPPTCKHDGIHDNPQTTPPSNEHPIRRSATRSSEGSYVTYGGLDMEPDHGNTTELEQKLLRTSAILLLVVVAGATLAFFAFRKK